MKVIANVDSNRVLCEVSIEELAWLNGFSSKYEQGCDIRKLTTVGEECKLDKMVTTSRFVRNLRKDVLSQVKLKLEQAVTDLDDSIFEVSKLELFEIIKTDELTKT
jgi:hypothetical protein